MKAQLITKVNNTVKQNQSVTRNTKPEKKIVKSRSVKRWIHHPCYLTSLHFKKRTISRITRKQINESARQTLGKTGLLAVRKERQDSRQLGKKYRTPGSR